MPQTEFSLFLGNQFKNARLPREKVMNGESSPVVKRGLCWIK